jgi:hypothetical protein
MGTRRKYEWKAVHGGIQDRSSQQVAERGHPANEWRSAWGEPATKMRACAAIRLCACIFIYPYCFDA